MEKKMISEIVCKLTLSNVRNSQKLYQIIALVLTYFSPDEESWVFFFVVVVSVVVDLESKESLQVSCS